MKLAKADEHGYVKGMREKYPDLCWWAFVLDGTEYCCILDRGHDDGKHEAQDVLQALSSPLVTEAESSGAVRDCIYRDQCRCQGMCAYDSSLTLQASYESRKVYKRPCGRCGDGWWLHGGWRPCIARGCGCEGFVERGALVQGAAR